MNQSLFKSLSTAAAACLFSSTLLIAQDGYLSEEDIYTEEIRNGQQISDPLEPINRVTFQVNDFFYTKLLAPVASVYTSITPDPVEESAENFFENLGYPVRLAGNLLQGRFDGAWVETGRFAINSTVGIAGLFRPADSVQGFEPIPDEDVGQAFGSWGIGSGPYLVLPLLGPSNVRDFSGYLVGRAVHPLEEPYSLIDDWNWEWRATLTASEIIVQSPSLLERYEQMKEGAIDPYGSLKNSYSQFRRRAIAE